MLNTKDAASFIEPFEGLAQRVVTIAIPGEPNAVPADQLAEIARSRNLSAETATSLDKSFGAGIPNDTCPKNTDLRFTLSGRPRPQRP